MEVRINIEKESILIGNVSKMEPATQEELLLILNLISSKILDSTMNQ